MRRDDPILERLRTIPLFADCTGDELALVPRHVTRTRARAGDVLVHEGRAGREFLVIVEGTASVVVGGRPVARVGPGEFVGEVALLDPGPRTATVVADTDVVALVSTAQEFRALVEGAPGLARALLVGLARRLRTADEQLGRTRRQGTP